MESVFVPFLVVAVVVVVVVVPVAVVVVGVDAVAGVVAAEVGSEGSMVEDYSRNMERSTWGCIMISRFNSLLNDPVNQSVFNNSQEEIQTSQKWRKSVSPPLVPV